MLGQDKLLLSIMIPRIADSPTEAWGAIVHVYSMQASSAVVPHAADLAIEKHMSDPGVDGIT